ncbi:MAG: hypothetical protein K2Y08_03280 [Alphaproteobacteria bacterium]|nr:hypothetical protein [Alphaproteobacteria bacterium]
MTSISKKKAAKKKAMLLEAETKSDSLKKEALYEVCARSMFSDICRWNKEKLDFLLYKRLEPLHRKFKRSI